MMSDDTILYSMEEQPIFEYYACEDDLVKKTIGEVLSFQPRLIIFNDCNLTKGCVKSILNRSDPFVFIVSDRLNDMCKEEALVYRKTHDESILVKTDIGTTGLILDVNAENHDYVMNNLFERNYQYKITINPMVFDKNKGIGVINFDMLYQKISEYNKTQDVPITMYHHILPTKFIREHPCNAYMLSECKCHSKKNNIPRHITIECDGTMKPYDHSVHQEFIMGNAVDGITYSLKKYYNSESHNLFITVCKRIFFNYISRTSSIAVPWRELFVIYSADDHF